jgi:hypothetical protein
VAPAAAGNVAVMPAAPLIGFTMVPVPAVALDAAAPADPGLLAGGVATTPAV